MLLGYLNSIVCFGLLPLFQTCLRSIDTCHLFHPRAKQNQANLNEVKASSSVVPYHLGVPEVLHAYPSNHNPNPRHHGGEYHQGGIVTNNG